MTEEKSKPNLLGAMRRGRAQGSLLTVGAPVTEINPSDGLADATRVLDEAEARFAADPALWVREWAATAARGALKTALEVEDAALAARAEALQARLRAVDEAEIGPVRRRLVEGGLDPDAFRAALDEVAPHERDAFVRRLLDIDAVPDRETVRPSGMVHYVASSLDVILAIASLVEDEDVFYDIGSGLGYVTMLVAWLTRAQVVGVEYDPAYHRLAAARAEGFGFSRLRYLQGDARHLDYADGTVFYFYDTVRDQLLEEVLARFETVARARRIRIVSRGHSNAPLEAVPWLEVLQRGPHELLVLASTLV